MSEISKKEVRELLKKYEKRMNKEMVSPQISEPEDIISREYQQFKKENYPKQLSAYEKLCNISEKILKVSPDKKQEPLIRKQIETCHLNVTPSGTVSFTLLATIVIGFFGGILSALSLKSLFFTLFFIMIALVLYVVFGKIL